MGTAELLTPRASGVSVKKFLLIFSEDQRLTPLRKRSRKLREEGDERRSFPGCEDFTVYCNTETANRDTSLEQRLVGFGGSSSLIRHYRHLLVYANIHILHIHQLLSQKGLRAVYVVKP
ncbi:hypothetical protein DUI87_17261 [Hirundo rustica rustica]|uniref:Uncharacterized protein n=1 Tax=Hirundo rustica rustica TaxID=333673 RepID=A0A3M0JY85_HIRRU|nr:hypothetical protein DUI87_17261 [Hirundo rustica rustica]